MYEGKTGELIEEIGSPAHKGGIYDVRSKLPAKYWASGQLKEKQFKFVMIYYIKIYVRSVLFLMPIVMCKYKTSVYKE